MRHSFILYFFYADYTIPIMKTYIIFLEVLIMEHVVYVICMAITFGYISYLFMKLIDKIDGV